LKIKTSINLKNKTTGAIGIFDSGIGGLSIAKCISEQLPNEDLIYVADSLHVPYGEKSVDFIIGRVNTIAEQLIKQDVKALVVACNTATVYAIEQLRARLSAQLDIPIIGVEPAIKPAAKSSRTKKVAVLVTQATSENQRFKALINTHKSDAEVFIQACPGLVEIIEKGQQHSIHCQQLLIRYITPLIEQGVDTLVLGCTHYPFLQQQITAIIQNLLAKNQITLIETAMPVSLQLSNKLEHAKLFNQQIRQGQTQFFSSRPSKQQESLISTLWQAPIKLKTLA